MQFLRVMHAVNVLKIVSVFPNPDLFLFCRYCVFRKELLGFVTYMGFHTKRVDGDHDVVVIHS